MTKDPAFLFYFQDFMYGTRYFSDLQRGIYIHLMCEQADSESGSILKEHMNNICKTYDEDTLSPVLKKFQKDDNGFYNSVLREHLIKRRKYSESRRNNRISKKKEKDIINISKTYDKHMVNTNVNVNVNKDINKDKKHKYGSQKNVLLKDSEIEKLKEKFGNSFEKILNNFSDGIAIKNYGYKNHYLAILKWNKDFKENSDIGIDYDK